MNVKLQLISIIFSFLFGLLFSFFTNINYRFLFSKNTIFKLIFTFIYIIDSALFYFLMMKKINNGIIHIYFLIFIVVGFLFGFIKLNKYYNIIKNKMKKCLISVKK